MTRHGSFELDDIMQHPSDPGRYRRLLGALPLLAMGCVLARPAHAAPAPQGTLPTVTITTTMAALSASLPAEISDGTGIAANVAQVQPKPKPAHRATHFEQQTIDTASLSAPLSDGAGALVRRASSMVIEARATALRPAPLPDQDMDAPGPDAQTLAAQQQASLSPSYYGHANHFSGDGFSAGSNLENDKNNRRRPGGGMSLSIPVQ